MTVTTKYRNVIVEGPDCSGKSTLVERLKNTLHWDSKYLRHADGNQFYRYLKEYALCENTVFDRAHYSEHVYSQMWRGGSPFSKQEKQILDSIVDMHSLVIFCLPSEKNMRDRYQSRGFEQQISLPELTQSYKLFQDAVGGMHLVYRSANFDELEALLVKVKETIA